MLRRVTQVLVTLCPFLKIFSVEEDPADVCYCRFDPISQQGTCSLILQINVESEEFVPFHQMTYSGNHMKRLPDTVLVFIIQVYQSKALNKTREGHQW